MKKLNIKYNTQIKFLTELPPFNFLFELHLY